VVPGEWCRGRSHHPSPHVQSRELGKTFGSSIFILRERRKISPKGRITSPFRSLIITRNGCGEWGKFGFFASIPSHQNEEGEEKAWLIKFISILK